MRLAALLAKLWPDATCELDHRNAYELLVATILAAQSTDKLINTVTPALFSRYPDATALAAADPAELEQLIHSTGFFRMKAKHLLGMARAVVERHGGQVPSTMEELVKLPGVARKTANVVLGTAFGKAEGVVVDTHVTRLAARLGLTSETDPVKIEHDLQAQLPRDEWVTFPNRLIWHGRRVCFAKKPACETCGLAALCPAAELPAHGEPGAAAAGRKKPAKTPSGGGKAARPARDQSQGKNQGKNQGKSREKK